MNGLINKNPLTSGGLLGLKLGGGLGIAPYGVRHSGLGAKGNGFFGPIPAMMLDHVGGFSLDSTPVATEYSMEGNIRGKNVEFPSIVPTLDRQQLNQVLQGNVSDDVYQKALAHAIMRLDKGLSPFASPNEFRYPLPK